MASESLCSILKRSDVDLPAFILKEIHSLESKMVADFTTAFHVHRLEMLDILVSSLVNLDSHAAEVPNKDILHLSADMEHIPFDGKKQVVYGKVIHILNTWYLVRERLWHVSQHPEVKKHVLHLFDITYPRSEPQDHRLMEEWFLHIFKELVRDDITEWLDVHLVMAVGNTIIKCSKQNATWTDTIFVHVLQMVLSADKDIVGNLVGLIIPELLNHSVNTEQKLSELWAATKTLHNEHGQKTYRVSNSTGTLSERPLLILCGFDKWFFPLTAELKSNLSILADPSFWTILQTGFFSNSGLTRKRSLYIFKRILDTVETKSLEISCLASNDSCTVPLFWWQRDHSVKIARTWQDFILLIETLEEKQIHVIKPIMPRFANLVAASALHEGLNVLHTSWICAMVQRIAGHESAFIRRWGILELLQIDMTKCPMLNQTGEDLMCGPFVEMLTETALFYKPPELPLGSCPPAGEHLVTFLVSCLKALSNRQQQGHLLETFIHSLGGRQWSGLSLLLVSRALAGLPQAKVCKPQIILDIRDLLIVSMTNIEVHIRGAIQCFFTTAVTKLLDTRISTPGDLLPLLAVLRSDECLARGTASWTELVSWLQDAANDSAWTGLRLHSFVEEQFSSTSKANCKADDDSVIMDVRPAARLLLLAADAGILPPVADNSPYRSSHPLEAILRPSMTVLLTVNSHAYMSPTRADRGLRILTIVFQESRLLSGNDELMNLIDRLVRECLDEILLFVLRRISSDSSDFHHVNSITYYVEVLETLSSNGLDIFACPHVLHMKKQLLKVVCSEKSDPPTTARQISYFSAVAVVGSLAKCLSSSSNQSQAAEQLLQAIISMWGRRKPSHEFARPSDIDSTQGIASLGPSAWGRIAAIFIQGQWQIILLLLEGGPCPGSRAVDSTDVTNWALEALDVLSGASIIPVLRCLKMCMTKIDHEKVAMVIDIIWRKVKEESRNTLAFGPCVAAAVDTIFQPHLLMSSGDGVTEAVRALLDEMFTVGAEKAGLVNTVMQHLCILWRSHPSSIQMMTRYSDAIISAVTFGSIHDKSKKYFQEAVAFVNTLGDSLSINALKDSNVRSDSYVRVMGFSILSRLSLGSSPHTQFAHSMLRHIMKKHKELNMATTCRNFTNSMAHREKHRLLVAALLLEPFIYEGMTDEMVEYLMDALVHENHPSVRVMVEWMLIRVILRRVDVFNTVLTNIQRTDEKRMAFLCSLFTVLTQAAKYMDSDNQEKTILRLLPDLVPWCSMHHFNCRTFAQACILVLWRVCKEHNLTTVLHAHSIIENLAQFQMENINQSKGTQKLLDNFFFHFNPIEDYSIETLTWTLPRLTYIVDEEWIHPQLFATFDPDWSSSESASPCNIPLINARRVLDSCQPGTWKIKFVETDDFEVSAGNVQKKMVPWMSMLPETHLETDLLEEYQGRRQGAGRLIVVASLIDKVPNLGGLCRTSEIFGAEEFVLSNLKHVNSHEFATLSVTAQKWVPIKEVRPHLLKEYLLEVKAEGYTLVGAEQTSDSVSLPDYSFAEKTVLLLGNEKEGIPVELIQLLDVCVEIPQQGIIRSLNVHVSGALLIWEYTRQRLAQVK